MSRFRLRGTRHVELVDGDVALDGDGLGADVVQQADDGLVAAHDLGPEAADGALARGVAEVGDQQPADAARLHVVHGGDRGLGRVAFTRETDEARHADGLHSAVAGVAPWREGDVVDAVRV